MTNKPAYTLLDAVARHTETPDTFEIPDDAELVALASGDYVKIGIVFDPQAKVGPVSASRAAWGAKVGEQYAAVIDTERLWVKLTAIVRLRPVPGYTDNLVRFHGVISNNPVYTEQHGVIDQLPMVLERRHILATFQSRGGSK